ncbi:DNA starvation/stationary phase protection protein [Streptomyces sp. OfavH-34-F]|uniref:Dps family protein n=1 Tax=Streptomyces sp. OfavH-34-F TaxID=2917760 RepID=UPI001EF1BDBB|nr:DNA starvation/stationary phase protection protein [Streptomyces sp. OfavH-34-F]MCG7524199.1 DNA starvation/stationary phase protection protein [Streptomyces sp. OfavH-34-F]
MTTVKRTIPQPAGQAVGSALQDTLVDLLGLSLIGKQVHWNVVGPRFRSVHLQVDELVTATREAADTVAERAATLGVAPDGRPATVAAGFALPGPEAGWTRDDDVVELMTEALGAAAVRLRERIDATENADPVTQDLLIAITAELEKQRWLFAAQTITS